MTRRPPSGSHASAGPSRTLDAQGRLVHLFAHTGEGAEVLVDRRGQFSLGLAAAVGRHVLPEQRVQNVPRDVEGQVLLELVEVAELTGLPSGCESGGGGVGALHVGSVVLVVVQLHDLAGVVGLQRAGVVGQFGQRVFGHRRLLVVSMGRCRVLHYYQTLARPSSFPVAVEPVGSGGYAASGTHPGGEPRGVVHRLFRTRLRRRAVVALGALPYGRHLDRVALLLQLRPDAGLRRDDRREPLGGSAQDHLAGAVVVPLRGAAHAPHGADDSRVPEEPGQ